MVSRLRSALVQMSETAGSGVDRLLQVLQVRAPELVCMAPSAGRQRAVNSTAERQASPTSFQE